jgi:hypothetical protein
MLVLVATAQTQGQRADDFCRADEGELVRWAAECHQEPADGSCGCHRSLVGLASARPTTTARVVDRPDLDLAGLRARLAAAMTRDREIRPGDCASEAWVAVMAEELAVAAASFPPQTVLERRGQVLRRR